jgi:hypothetical protein
MNWDAIGATGEVLGAIAVVVSLVYLAFQIRQNTRQIDENTKAAQAAAFDSSIAHTFKARQAIVENSDVARIYLEGSNDPDSLSDEDRVRYRLIMHNTLWSLWNMQSQSRVGDLASETWNAQLATLKRIISTEGFRWFWGNYSQEFGASFQKIVDDLAASLR